MRSFALSRETRRAGGLLLGVMILVAGSAVAVATTLWPTQPLAAALGGVACGVCALLAGGMGLRTLWPRRLELSETGGALVVAGRPANAWRWSEAREIAWHAASTSRYAPEEPWLVLADGREIALDPFGPDAFHAVREQLLVGSLGA